MAKKLYLVGKATEEDLIGAKVKYEAYVDDNGETVTPAVTGQGSFPGLLWLALRLMENVNLNCIEGVIAKAKEKDASELDVVLNLDEMEEIAQRSAYMTIRKVYCEARDKYFNPIEDGKTKSQTETDKEKLN